MSDFASNPTFIDLPPGAEAYEGEPTKVPMTEAQRANGFIPEQPIAAEHLNSELGRITADISSAVSLAAESIQLANWAARAAAMPNQANGIAWIPTAGLFVAVGLGGMLQTSPNGNAWTARTSGSTEQLQGVASNPSGLILAVGWGFNVTVSTDGVTWTLQAPASSNDFHAVIWGPDLFILTDHNQYIWTTPTGAVLTNRTNPTGKFMAGLAWTGALAVGVGEDGAVVTSPTGTTWTSRTSGVAAYLCDVVWNGSLLCAVGANGTIITSPDGVVWTTRTSGVTVLLSAITWTGTRFVAVGAGTLITSLDGITWSVISHGLAAVAYEDIASNGLVCVSVGASGLVTRSLSRLAS